MRILILLLCLFFSAPALALSPVEENVHGKLLPIVTIDPKTKPYYEKLSTEQRNCNGEAPKVIRVIHEGDMITQDYSATRLNIELDKNDNILRAYCG